MGRWLTEIRAWTPEDAERALAYMPLGGCDKMVVFQGPVREATEEDYRLWHDRRQHRAKARLRSSQHRVVQWLSAVR